MSTRSILPDNRTLLETALEQALHTSLLSIDCPYPALWSPSTVPEHLLPYLAHAKGVTDWGGEADEAAQRHTVAYVWPVQRMAGTAQGVEDAVTGLGLTSRYVPGYTWGGPPYSFRVDIEGLRGVPVTRVMQRIDAAKSERDGYSVRVVYEPEQRLYLGGAVHQSPQIAIHYQPPTQSIPKQSLYLGQVVYQVQQVGVHYRPPAQNVGSQSLKLGRVLHQLQQTSVNYRPSAQNVGSQSLKLGRVLHQLQQTSVNYHSPAQTVSDTVSHHGCVLHMTRNIIIHR